MAKLWKVVWTGLSGKIADLVSREISVESLPGGQPYGAPGNPQRPFKRLTAASYVCPQASGLIECSSPTLGSNKKSAGELESNKYHARDLTPGQGYQPGWTDNMHAEP
jgi:hypothetical protein